LSSSEVDESRTWLKVGYDKKNNRNICVKGQDVIEAMERISKGNIQSETLPTLYFWDTKEEFTGQFRTLIVWCVGFEAGARDIGSMFGQIKAIPIAQCRKAAKLWGILTGQVIGSCQPVRRHFELLMPWQI
jgi:hypothetical protein